METFACIVGIVACFLFASGFAGSAAEAYHEKNWGVFGANLTLTVCFWFGICTIMQMWCGIV